MIELRHQWSMSLLWLTIVPTMIKKVECVSQHFHFLTFLRFVNYFLKPFRWQHLDFQTYYLIFVKHHECDVMFYWTFEEHYYLNNY